MAGSAMERERVEEEWRLLPPQHGACFEDEEKEGGKEGLEACANILS